MKLINYLTPIKVFAIILILMGIFNHITGPLNNCLFIETTQEYFIRIIFFFSGIFSLLGNGRTKEIRAKVVGFPYLYLAGVYILAFIQTTSYSLVLPSIMFLIMGLWVSFLGDKYE